MLAYIYTLLVIIASSGMLTCIDATLIEKLSLDQKIGQLLMVGCANDTDVNTLIHTIKTCHCGGVFFLAPPSLDWQIDTTNYAQQKSLLPLLVGQDLEWGLHMRHRTMPKFPYAATLGALAPDHNNLIYAMAKIIGRQARSIGVHVTAAPVVDVNTNPDNPIIGFRAFGNTPEKVVSKIEPYLHGLQESGVLTCVKHFPGHGDTHTDSHVGETYIHKRLEQLEKDELPPFKHAIGWGTDMIMAGHLRVPALDDQNPATLSPSIITGLLRKALKYDNIIITDALDMGAISNYYTPADASVKAFEAGNDILLFPEDVAQSYNALKKFITDNPEYGAQLDASVERILKAKEKLGLFENKYTKKIDKPEETLWSADDLNIRRALYQHAITLARGSISKVAPHIVVHLGNHGDMEPFNIAYNHHTPSYTFEQAMALTTNEPIVITFSTSARGIYDTQRLKELEQLTAKFNSTIVLFGGPEVIRKLPQNATVLIAYETDTEAQRAAADILNGKLIPTGILV